MFLDAVEPEWLGRHDLFAPPFWVPSFVEGRLLWEPPYIHPEDPDERVYGFRVTYRSGAENAAAYEAAELRGLGTEARLVRGGAAADGSAAELRVVHRDERGDEVVRYSVAVSAEGELLSLDWSCCAERMAELETCFERMVRSFRFVSWPPASVAALVDRKERIVLGEEALPGLPADGWLAALGGA